MDKRDFYLSHGVDEYWIVDLDARVIERWIPDRVTSDLGQDELVWHPRAAAKPLPLDVRAFFDSKKALPGRIVGLGVG